MQTAKFSRRTFLRLAAAAGATCTLPVLAAGAPRHLSFAHTHTGETLAITYWRDGRYDPIALKTIDHLLRDHRTGAVHAIEPRLLDYLHTVQCALECDAPFEVISGYRSPVTNDMLHRTTNGVATRSLHMDGRAIDVRLPGVRTARLRETAAALRLGGVGFYPDSGFVHLDTGRVRQW